MKRLLSLILALACCLSLVSTVAIAEEAPIELTIAVVRRQTDITESFNEKLWVKDAEETLNLKLNFVELMEGAVDEPLAALLAGDLPDVFFMGLQLSDSLVVQNTGLFRSITEEELQTYCPTYYNLMESYVDNWRDFMTYPDGNMYGMMSGNLTSEMHRSQGVQYLNYQWLENLGLEEPTTLEEFHDVLVAFRDQDANGNGDPNDEIPIDFCNQHYAANIMNFASAWGLAISDSTFYNVVDGDVVSAVDTDAFREFLEYFYQLGQEGLLNLEGFSQTQDQYNANLDAMKVGVFWGWGPYNYISGDNRLQYEGFVPVGPEEYETKLVPNQINRANRNGWVITKECENWEAALKLYDYWCEPTRALNVSCGVEEVCWYWLDEENLVYTVPNSVDEEKDPEGYAAWVEKMNEVGYGDYVGKNYAGSNTLGYVNNGPFFLNNASYDVEADRTVNAVTRLLAMRKFIDADALGECVPRTIVSAEDQEELDFMTDGLKDLINGFVAESVINGVTDESWEAFKADLNRYGYDFYIDFYNKLCHNEL